MAGILVPFLPMTAFDFSFLSSSGATKTIVVHPGLNVTGYYQARLIMRVHEIDMNGGSTPTAFIEVGGVGTLPSSADPREFSLSSSTLSVTTAGLSAGEITSDTDTDLYPFLKMYVKGSQSGTPGRVFAVLSADLLLRDA